MNILSHLAGSFQLFSQNFKQTDDIGTAVYALLQHFSYFY